MLPRLTRRRMILSSGHRPRLLLSIGIPLSTSVATSPASIPRKLLDMSDPPRSTSSNDRRVRTGWNCVALSQVLSVGRKARISPMQPPDIPSWHGTTILTVGKGGQVVIGGDGQVSIGQTIVKSNARKVRRLGKNDVIGGFAGATADAFTLFERLEAKLDQYPGQLM